MNWSVNIVQMNRIWVANISNRCIWWSKNQFPFLDLNLISIAAKRILQEILILRYLQKYMYYATHRNPPPYRSTSNFASSVLRILEERAFAVGNYQSIITVIVVITLNHCHAQWHSHQLGVIGNLLGLLPTLGHFLPIPAQLHTEGEWKSIALFWCARFDKSFFSKKASFVVTPI